MLIPEPLINLVDVTNKMEKGKQRWNTFVRASVATVFGGGLVHEFGYAVPSPRVRGSHRARRAHFQSRVSRILSRISERVVGLGIALGPLSANARQTRWGLLLRWQTGAISHTSI